MKALVVYDTKFGNTERLARVIAETLSVDEPVSVLPAMAASPVDLEDVELLVVGGPTQAHGLSEGLKSFFDRLLAPEIRGLPAATFDTRLTWPRLLSGSAAAAAHKRLTKLDAQLLMPPESFLVQGSEGPLVEGEIERARVWATDLLAKVGPLAREPVGATR